MRGTSTHKAKARGGSAKYIYKQHGVIVKRHVIRITKKGEGLQARKSRVQKQEKDLQSGQSKGGVSEGYKLA